MTSWQPQYARGAEEDVDPNLVGYAGHHHHQPPPLVRHHYASPHQSTPAADPPRSGWHDATAPYTHRGGDESFVMIGGHRDAGVEGNSAYKSQSAQMSRIESEEVGRDYEPETPLIYAAAAGQAQHTQEDQRFSNIHDVFHDAHGGRKRAQPQLGSYDEQEPIQLGHLFRRPVIRQFLHDGKLYREKFERESSRFELFFDLAFVGIAHQLADGLSESESARGLNVAKFALTFFPLYSIGVDVRTYINQSGLDDVWSRLYLLMQMLIMTGYTANAVAVKIYSAHDGNVLNESGEQELIRRAAAKSTEERPDLVTPIGHTGYYFADGYLYAITAAAAFYLLSKVIKLLMLFVCGLYLPKFRRPLWLRMVPVVLLAAIYVPIPAVPVYQAGWITLLLSLGVGLDILSRYFISYATQWWHGHSKRAKRQFYIPADSIEHTQERTILFVLLFAGEAVLSSTYSASIEQIGVKGEFGRSALSIITAFCLLWVYFDADASRVFVHALRRNPFTAITFNVLHFPLTGALILLSSTLHNLVGNTHSEQGFRWYYGGSMSCVLGTTAIIGLLHKNLDVVGSAKWPHEARIALRAIVAAVYAAVPILDSLSNTAFLATYTGLLVLLVISETLGKLGAVGRRFDPVKADQYYAALKNQRNPSVGGDQGNDGSRLRYEKRDSPDSIEMGERAENGVGGPPAAGRSGFAERKANFASRFFNPYTSGVRLSRRSSWHPYDDLTADEQGNEDVGIEGEIGQMEVKERLDKGQRWAVVSS